MRGRKGQEDVARTVGAPAAHSRQTDRRSFGQPLQLQRVERRIRRDDHDDAAVLLVPGRFRPRELGLVGPVSLLCDEAADGCSPDSEIRQFAVVALDEGGDGVLGRLLILGLDSPDEAIDDPTRAAGAAFVTVAEHAGATSRIPFLDRFRTRILNPLHNMFRLHGQRADIVHEPIVRLRHDREQKPITKPLRIPVLADTILVDARIAGPNRKRIRDDDGRVEQSRLIEPVTARHFSTPVEAEIPGIAALIEEVGAGKDGGDARVDDVGGFAGRALDGEGVDEDAGHVGQGVQGPRRVPSDLQGGEEFPDAHAFRRGDGGGGGRHSRGQGTLSDCPRLSFGRGMCD